VASARAVAPLLPKLATCVATTTFAKRRDIIEEEEREWLSDAIGLHRLRRMPFVTLHHDGSPAIWWNDVPTKGGIKAIHADRRRGEAYADMLVDALVADDAKGCTPLWLVINAIVDILSKAGRVL
jgi:hypothetical protein